MEEARVGQRRRRAMQAAALGEGGDIYIYATAQRGRRRPAAASWGGKEARSPNSVAD